MATWTREIPPERRYVDALLHVHHPNSDGLDRKFKAEIVPPLQDHGIQMNVQVCLNDGRGRNDTSGINLDREEVEQLRDLCNEFLRDYDKEFTELRTQLEEQYG